MHIIYIACDIVSIVLRYIIKIVESSNHQPAITFYAKIISR